MCDICQRERCAPRCPNAPPPSPSELSCSLCGVEIASGAPVLQKGREAVCTACVRTLRADDVLALCGAATLRDLLEECLGWVAKRA